MDSDPIESKAFSPLPSKSVLLQIAIHRFQKIFFTDSKPLTRFPRQKALTPPAILNLGRGVQSASPFFISSAEER
jgi:hypothetical protein